MQITANFHMSEFAVSHQFPKLVKPVPAEYYGNVIAMCLGYLQPTRDKWGALHVNSGYRSEELNKALGGSPSSQHRHASATDFTRQDIFKVYLWMFENQSVLKLGQVIWYPEKLFVHAAVPSPKYTAPSFHVHRPSKGYEYVKVASIEDIQKLVK